MLFIYISQYKKAKYNLLFCFIILLMTNKSLHINANIIFYENFQPALFVQY